MQFENDSIKEPGLSKKAPGDIKNACSISKTAEQDGKTSIYDFAELWITRNQPPYLV
ncbi:MAG: hypothetical protein KGQ58_07685 [Proteobacteria bacterium]|nr:hypothetical protein [Pseudomonadota bacterium]